MLGFQDRVNMKVENGNLLVSPVQKKVREGWEEMIMQEIEANGEPDRLMPDFFEDEEIDEWKW